MTLWLDMLGVEIKYVMTPSFGKTRVAEIGKENPETIIFMHGINGHFEAYAKNMVELSKNFHIVAYDYVGHGLSDKPSVKYSPPLLADHLEELMDSLGLAKAHLSGESLGGWVAGLFATSRPERVGRIMLNTTGGIPVVSERGMQDLRELQALNARIIDNTPSAETVRSRLEWLMHKNNHSLINDELINLRMSIYLREDTKAVAQSITDMIGMFKECAIPLDQIKTDTLFLWTHDNPIHDVEAARSAAKQVAGCQLYIMNGDSAHWPQYEQPEEFNRVAREFFGSSSGSVAGSELF